MDACKRSFGESVLYTTDAGDGDQIEITAIVDQAFEVVDPNTGAYIISEQPIIGIKDDDLPSAPQKGDLVTARSTDYQVIEVQKDGQAGSKLLLHKV